MLQWVAVPSYRVSSRPRDQKKTTNQQENHIQINTEPDLMIYMLKGLGRKDTGDCNLLQSPAKQKEMREG